MHSQHWIAAATATTGVAAVDNVILIALSEISYMAICSILTYTAHDELYSV